VLEKLLRATHLKSIGESETSNTATSDDDFEIVCHGSKVEFELGRCRKEDTQIKEVNQR
jgi:hypothetical protein